MTRPQPRSTLFPYTTLFRSSIADGVITTDLGGTILLINSVAESRSEEHTSELQSRFDLVCRLLLEKKNKIDLGQFVERVGTSHTDANPPAHGRRRALNAPLL